MKLTSLEKDSALWTRISEELKTRLQVLREKNDGNHDTEETAKIRGSIAEVKLILGWSETNPKFDGD